MSGPDGLGAHLLPILDVDEPLVIRMRHDPTQAAQRLLVTLGAGWTIDAEAERCVRHCGRPECDVLSAHDLLVTRDCISPGCPREAAHGNDLCDEHIRKPPRPRVDDAELFGAFADDEPHERRTMSTVATTTCKKDGCEKEPNPRFTRGYQYGLCDEHAAERGLEIADARRHGGLSGSGGGISSTSPPPLGQGYLARVRALMPAARSLDQAKRKLDAAGTNQTLQAEFAEASRRATAVPNAENLERLEHASKQLRRGAPQAAKTRTAFAAAEREFKLALAALAQDFRTN